ncbi:MAG TPA: molybdopterin-dependent oxidoreductase [Vicinamibacteria bacterium]|nr:molybdopterin-dependent oxidoreductase [Vicinamibacteria bacterium]
MDQSRRRFLELFPGAALAAWLPSLAEAASDVGAAVPFLGEGSFPLERTVGLGLGRRRALDLSTLSRGSLLVPSDRFFIRTASPDRLPDAASWKVRVAGLVEAPLDIPIDSLRREAEDQGVQLLECAGNSRAAHFGLMSAARFSGVRLGRVLERVRALPRATHVLVSGFDEHATLDPGSVSGASWIFTLDQIRESGAFLATEMNGAPLRADHGFPVRLVVPGWYACAAIKWVNEIVLLADDAPATDHMREYAGRTHQDPEAPLARDFQPATIDPAAVPVRVERGAKGDGRAEYRIDGVLWGGTSRPRALSIRLNPGQAFVPVQEIGADGPEPWTLWSHNVRSLEPGRYRIELAIREGSVRTRRLDAGFYAREIQIPGG